MTHLPLFRVRSWNHGMRCISFHILIKPLYTGDIIWRRWSFIISWGSDLTDSDTKPSIEPMLSSRPPINRVSTSQCILLSAFDNNHWEYSKNLILKCHFIQLSSARELEWYSYIGPWKARTSLTHWGRVMHICVSKLANIGSDNGVSPRRHQAIIWTNAGILLIRLLGTKFNEILIEIHTFL